MQAGSGKVQKVSLDQRAAQNVNLSTVQKIDVDVSEILSKVSHVVVYEFDTSTQAWVRRNIEGTMFVVKRTSSPRFRFIIMNRLNPENFLEDIGDSFQLDVNYPFLMYRADPSSSSITGVWFHDGREHEQIAGVIKRILRVHNTTSSASVSASAGSREGAKPTIAAPSHAQKAKQRPAPHTSGSPPPLPAAVPKAASSAIDRKAAPQPPHALPQQQQQESGSLMHLLRQLQPPTHAAATPAPVRAPPPPMAQGLSLTPSELFSAASAATAAASVSPPPAAQPSAAELSALRDSMVALLQDDEVLRRLHREFTSRWPPSSS